MDLQIALQPIGGKKSDHVYKVLKQAILFRQFPPDTQFLETSLATQFACSQSTVREALLRLGEDGLVKRSGYQGTRVTDTSLAEAIEMVGVRLSIERGVARAISANGVESHRKELEKMVADMDRATGDGDLYWRSSLDRSFHSKLVEAAGMGLLSPILERCALHIHRYTLGGIDVPRKFFQESGVGDEHRALLAELTTGDQDRAESAIVSHLEQVLKRWAPSLYSAVGDAAFDTDPK